jgi:hypothetical protein
MFSVILENMHGGLRAEYLALLIYIHVYVYGKQTHVRSNAYGQVLFR